jgi:single-strand DNA-binding protein
MNRVILMGNICADPEMRTTDSGKSACNFRIAVRRNYKNANGEHESDFLTCKAYGGTADFVNKYFVKGSKIIVEGTIQTSSWTKDDGSKGYATDIIVSSVEFAGSRSEGGNPPPKKDDIGTPVNDDDLPF